MHVHIHAFLFLVEKCEDHNKNIGLGYYSAHISEAVHHRFQQIIDSLGGINAEHHPKYMERLGMIRKPLIHTCIKLRKQKKGITEDLEKNLIYFIFKKNHLVWFFGITKAGLYLI